MRVGYFSDFKSLFGRSSLRTSSRIANFPTHAATFRGKAYKALELDADTQKDLELFQSQGGGTSLFDFYNRCVTRGGSRVFRHRMQQPFAEADDIHKAQDAVVFIQSRREEFRKIPFYITSRVERYQRDPLMFITQKNALHFVLGSTRLKLFDAYHYRRIHRGVQYSCLFIRSIREFLSLPEMLSPPGELAAVVKEMKHLLEDTGLARVPEHELRGGRFLAVLRLDQTFRIFDKEAVLRLMHLTYELDALISMADASAAHNYVMPELLQSDLEMHAQDLVYPQITAAVANTIVLNQDSRLLFLTGPNMAGKTTFLRAVATALYLGHLGMGVPASRFAFQPVERLFSSLSVSDNVHTGTSYFLAEVLRIKAVASAIAAGHSVIAIMDEPFKGTNVKDALEASLTVMQGLESKPDCLFLFSSHLIELDEQFGADRSIKRCYFEARESTESLEFDYVLQQGVSSQRLGMRVLGDQGVLKLLAAQVD